MNKRLVAHHLGSVAWLIGAAMIFSLPWAWPQFGHTKQLEVRGLFGLLLSMIIALGLGAVLRKWGGSSSGALFRKEAMAIVGLSWVLATVLGGLPFWLSRTACGLVVELVDGDQFVQVRGRLKRAPSADQMRVLRALTSAGARGLTTEELNRQTSLDAADRVAEQLQSLDDDWRYAILPAGAGDDAVPPEDGRIRIRPAPMTLVDCFFESQSGFSTTGATVLARIEDAELVPRSVLFWRSSTHFLGGLGIMVLFVAVLGQGSAGKAMMRAEIPGPSKDSSQTRMQHAAWTFGGTYCLLTVVLAVLLHVEGMNWFDAMCHAFGTMATGGFSTYDRSLGHFDSALIDYTVIVFMILAGTNFTLLYLAIIGRFRALLSDVEWQVYIATLFVATVLVVIWGMGHADFATSGVSPWDTLLAAVRYGAFQVVSIMTTTGFGTHDFDKWNNFGRGALFLLTFVGGCAGSTGGGVKVIRHILFHKVMRLEVEHAFHPSVVRPLRLAGKPVDDPSLRHQILVYFSLILAIFVISWMALVMIEPDSTWSSGGQRVENKLIDSATCVSATLNNIGPGLGVIGASENYAKFSPLAKLLFVFLMMLGRLELFVILVMFMPSFWRTY